MAAGLRLWLLGGFRAEVGGYLVPERQWHRRKACSLVKLLALTPRHRLHREQLMDALWPHLPPDAAGANLRKAVYFVRQVIGAEALRSRGDSVWLETDGLWVDIDAFQAAIAAGDAVGALGLFGGDLLPDDRFEPWAEDRRELFRMQLFHLALAAAAELERAEDLSRAGRVLDRVIELDPLNEEAHLGLARVQVKAGHRHLALRTCQQFTERVRRVRRAPFRSRRGHRTVRGRGRDRPAPYGHRRRPGGHRQEPPRPGSDRHRIQNSPVSPHPDRTVRRRRARHDLVAPRGAAPPAVRDLPRGFGGDRGGQAPRGPDLHPHPGRPCRWRTGSGRLRPRGHRRDRHPRQPAGPLRTDRGGGRARTDMAPVSQRLRGRRTDPGRHRGPALGRPADAGHGGAAGHPRRRPLLAGRHDPPRAAGIPARMGSRGRRLLGHKPAGAQRRGERDAAAPAARGTADPGADRRRDPRAVAR